MTRLEIAGLTPEDLGWPSGFFDTTFGSFRDEPIMRWEQGAFEVREEGGVRAHLDGQAFTRLTQVRATGAMPSDLDSVAPRPLMHSHMSKIESAVTQVLLMGDAPSGS